MEVRLDCESLKAPIPSWRSVLSTFFSEFHTDLEVGGRELFFHEKYDILRGGVNTCDLASTSIIRSPHSAGVTNFANSIFFCDFPPRKAEVDPAGCGSSHRLSSTWEG